MLPEAPTNAAMRTHLAEDLQLGRYTREVALCVMHCLDRTADRDNDFSLNVIEFGPETTPERTP